MSRENVELVRQGFEAYRRRDIAGFLAFLDPGFELHSAIVGGAEGKIYRGHDGAREWLADSDEAFDQLTIEPTEFRDLGNRVVVLGRSGHGAAKAPWKSTRPPAGYSRLRTGSWRRPWVS